MKIQLKYDKGPACMASVFIDDKQVDNIFSFSFAFDADDNGNPVAGIATKETISRGKRLVNKARAYRITNVELTAEVES